MKIMKKFSSLALVSARNQKMPTIDVIFERYDDECVFIYGSFGELYMARAVSETIFQAVDLPIL